MTTEQMEAKATEYAQKVSENASVFVYNRDGVYWLAVRTETSYRTLLAVGISLTGIRRIKSDIAAYFADR